MTQAPGLWGLLAAGSFLIGQPVATPLGHSARTVGLMMMASGAGTLISAVGYEPDPRGEPPAGRSAALFSSAPRPLRRRPDHRPRRDLGPRPFVSARPVDGIPESFFILGLGLALGGSISVAFLAAVLLSNVPEGLATPPTQAPRGSASRVTLDGRH